MSFGDRRYRLAVLVAVTVLIADQFTKAIVRETMILHEEIPLLPFLSITYARNTGAAFSLLAGAPSVIRLSLFVGITVAAMFLLASYLRQTPEDRPWQIAALGMVLGGAAGNLICRIRYGEVIDFVLLHWDDLAWPVFNVADSAISVGVGLLLLSSFRSPPASA